MKNGFGTKNTSLVAGLASQQTGELRKSCVVFDFDGTLANTREVVIHIYNELAEKYNFRKVTISDYKKLRGQSYFSVLRWTGIHVWQLPKLITEGRKLFNGRTDEIKLFPGVKETLIELNSQGYLCYVLSSNTPKTIKKVIHNQGLDFLKVLPSASLFGKAATLKSLKHKNKSRQLIMIGDELRDVSAAKKAKVAVIAVAWGFQSRDVLETGKPDTILEKPAQLIDAISAIQKA